MARTGCPPTTLDANLSELLRACDDKPNWEPLLRYPPLPPTYPPPLPPPIGPRPRYDSLLEWVGDALVDFAAIQCIHHAYPNAVGVPLADDPSRSLKDYIISNKFLSHLGLLYEFGLPSEDLPMDTIGSRLESVVGLIWRCLGTIPSLRWTEDLLHPWVETQPVSPTPLQPTVPQSLERLLARAPPVPGYFRDPAAYFSAELPRFWPIDTSAIHLPSSYPPQPRQLDQALASAIRDGQCYRRHAHLGSSAFNLIVTLHLEATGYSRSKGRLDILRVALTSRKFVARLGLSFGVHHRLLHSGGKKDGWWVIAPSQAVDAFYALVGSVYVESGWEHTHSWLGELLRPWITAAIRGQFNPDPEATAKLEKQTRRQEDRWKHQQAVKSRKVKDALKGRKRY